MATDLQDLTSATFSTGTSTTKITNGGITITPSALGEGKPAVSLTGTGLDNGGNTITNVKAGEIATDAATVGQVDQKIADGNKTINTNITNLQESDKLSVKYDSADKTSITLGSTDATAPIVLTNVASGLPIGTSLADAKGNTLTNAANIGDIQTAVAGVGTVANGGGFGLSDGTTSVKQDLGKDITVKGTNGVTITADNTDKTLTIGLGSDITAGDIENAGTITVKGETGKDGVTINGADGSIGLKGVDGKDGISLKGAEGTIGINGTDGANADITVQNGASDLNGIDGTTRIVYTDGKGNDQQVATLNDDLKFQGDVGTAVSKKLNETLTIKGNVDKDAAVTDKNIRVDNDGGELILKMATDLSGLNTATFGSGSNTAVIIGDGATFTMGNSIAKITGDGIELSQATNAARRRVARALAATDSLTTYAVKVSSTGLDNGNYTIKGVAPGVNDTDAVNLGQLNDAIAGIGGFTVVAEGKNITVEKTTTDGVNTYTVATADNLSVTSVTTTDAAGNTTTTNATGVTVTNGTNTVSVAATGIDAGGSKITNVATGTADGDAVNYGQIKNLINNGGGAGTLDIAGDSGTGSVGVGLDTFTVKGSDYVTTTASKVQWPSTLAKAQKLPWRK